MAYSTEQLKQVHPEYRNNRARFQFLIDSYNGGADYARGQYLTRYVYENDQEYSSRIAQTPLDNHCRSICNIYNGFMFAKPPKREFGDLTENPLLNDFLIDCDFEGRSWDAFMREVMTQASIYGTSWVVVDRPTIEAVTRADEINLGIRPYVSLYSAINVLDWRYERNQVGRYELVYLKTLEDQSGDYTIVNMFYPDRIDRVRYETLGSNVELISSTPNPAAKIPAVCVYNQRSSARGIGISDLNDIADLQRAIYDELSEIEQLIRISNHPSLVSTQSVQAQAGAGSRIIIDENSDGNLKPYLLQPDSQSLDGIRAAITDKVAAINQIANVSSIRSTETRTMSGVARDTEYKLLNSQLTQKADSLELAEEQIFDIVFELMGYPGYEYTIDYPETFSTRDKISDLNLLEKAKTILSMPALPNTDIEREIALGVIELVFEDSTGYQSAVDSILSMEEAEEAMEFQVHEMVNPETGESQTVTSEEQHNELSAQGWIHP